MKKTTFVLCVCLLALAAWAAQVANYNPINRAPNACSPGDTYMTAKFPTFMDDYGNFVMCNGTSYVPLQLPPVCHATPPTTCAVAGMTCLDGNRQMWVCKDAFAGPTWFEAGAAGSIFGKTDWTQGRVPFFNGTSMTDDAGFSYDWSTDTLSVGSLQTADPGDGHREISMLKNTSACDTPASGSVNTCFVGNTLRVINSSATKLDFDTSLVTAGINYTIQAGAATDTSGVTVTLPEKDSTLATMDDILGPEFSDTTFRVVDSTKKMAFDPSLLTAGVTYTVQAGAATDTGGVTITLPATAGTLALKPSIGVIGVANGTQGTPACVAAGYASCDFCIDGTATAQSCSYDSRALICYCLP